jgi:hypothetical protein
VGEVEYELWANENDALYINKTKDLQPEEENANIMVIKLANPDDGGRKIDRPAQEVTSRICAFGSLSDSSQNV